MEQGSDKNGKSTKFDKYQLIDYDLFKNTNKVLFYKDFKNLISCIF